MNKTAVEILDRHGLMALATVRADRWPQATCVSYVNDALIIYFLISRSSQKYENIRIDGRVSIAIGADPGAPAQIEGLSIAAQAWELRDEPQRTEMLKTLSRRHPGYITSMDLDWKHSALMRAIPEIISVVDFSRGLGHAESFTVGAQQIVEMMPARLDNWGPNPSR